MFELNTSVKELIWLASYYERNGMPENARIILEAIENTRHLSDEWAPIRYIEDAVAKLDGELKSA